MKAKNGFIPITEFIDDKKQATKEEAYKVILTSMKAVEHHFIYAATVNDIPANAEAMLKLAEAFEKVSRA